MNIEKTIESLKRNGYEVSYFETGKEAVGYLRDTVKVTTAMDAITTGIHFLSANAMSENGEIVNIDAGGNRLAGPMNCRRFGLKTPCAIGGSQMP